MSKNVVSLPRLSVAVLLVLLVVSSVMPGQSQPEAWAQSGGASPGVSAEDETSSVGRSDAPEPMANATDTPVLTRWTVDGGGGVFATGGDLELSGTIGQPDVGFASGGELTLAGGFWFPLADGDCNTDGGVNLIDFGGLQPCLSGPDGGVGPGCRCFDVDQDGDVDLSDMAVFQQAFTGG